MEAPVGLEMQSLMKQLFTRPDAVARRIRSNSPLQSALLERFKPQLDALREKSAPIDKLYRRFLPPLKPDATIAFFGHGTGDELLHIRKYAPDARLFAVDNTRDPQIRTDAVMTELATGAEHIGWDLAKTKPVRLIQRLGETPDLIICRHPNIKEVPEMSDVIATWARVLATAGGHMLVTTYNPLEAQIVLTDTKATPMTLSMWNDGAMVVDRDTGESLRSDQYVLVL